MPSRVRKGLRIGLHRVRAVHQKLKIGKHYLNLISMSKSYILIIYSTFSITRDNYNYAINAILVRKYVLAIFCIFKVKLSIFVRFVLLFLFRKNITQKKYKKREM